MPLFYQQDINLTTKIGAWQIGEAEDFFLHTVPLQRTITHPHKRLQHLAGRYLLPLLFPDFPQQEILIADTRKPFLPHEQYHFSISHCADYAAAIVSSSQRVGIDIEMITPRVEKIKHKFLHTDELVFVHSHHPDEQIPLLTLLWSAKEAMFKWWGDGEIDFSEALRTAAFTFNDIGVIPATFSKHNRHVPLDIHYQVRKDLVLAWVTGSS